MWNRCVQLHMFSKMPFNLRRSVLKGWNVALITHCLQAFIQYSMFWHLKINGFNSMAVEWRHCIWIRPRGLMLMHVCRMEGCNQTYQDKLFCELGTAITEQVFFISLFTSVIRLIGAIPSLHLIFSLHCNHLKEHMGDNSNSDLANARYCCFWHVMCLLNSTWTMNMYWTYKWLRWTYCMGVRALSKYVLRISVAKVFNKQEVEITMQLDLP